MKCSFLFKSVHNGGSSVISDQLCHFFRSVFFGSSYSCFSWIEQIQGAVCTPVEKPNDLISGTAHYFDRLKLHGVTGVSVSVLENTLPNLLTICAFYKVAGATTLLDFLFFFKPIWDLLWNQKSTCMHGLTHSGVWTLWDKDGGYCPLLPEWR